MPRMWKGICAFYIKKKILHLKHTCTYVQQVFIATLISITRHFHKGSCGQFSCKALFIHPRRLRMFPPSPGDPPNKGGWMPYKLFNNRKEKIEEKKKSKQRLGKLANSAPFPSHWLVRPNWTPIVCTDLQWLPYTPLPNFIFLEVPNLERGM